MATLANKRRLAALNKENCEDHPESNLEQNSDVRRSQQYYKTQVSEGIEGRVTKKLSQEFSRTENRILGALSRLDDYLMNTLIQGQFATAPETSRNAFSTKQGTNEDDSQSDPHPQAGNFHNQTTRNSGPEEGHDLVTGVHEEVTYCSLITSSGKQKKTALPVNRNFAVKIPLRRLKQTKVCWHFSSWWTRITLQYSTRISTEFPNCQNLSRQQCPNSTGNLKSLSCLKSFSNESQTS